MVKPASVDPIASEILETTTVTAASLTGSMVIVPPMANARIWVVPVPTRRTRSEEKVTPEGRVIVKAPLESVVVWARIAPV